MHCHCFDRYVFGKSSKKGMLEIRGYHPKCSKIAFFKQTVFRYVLKVEIWSKISRKIGSFKKCLIIFCHCFSFFFNNDLLLQIIFVLVEYYNVFLITISFEFKDYHLTKMAAEAKKNWMFKVNNQNER